MGVNPDNNQIERLGSVGKEYFRTMLEQAGKVDPGAFHANLIRPNGGPVPKHWAVFREGEHVVVKNQTFKVAYINESGVVLEPVSAIIGGGK